MTTPNKPIVAEWMREAASRKWDNAEQLAEYVARKHAEGCIVEENRVNTIEFEEAVKELVEAAEQAREAAAAAFRVAEQTGTWDALETEMKKAGVCEGFGKRLDSAITRVEKLL